MEYLNAGQGPYIKGHIYKRNCMKYEDNAVQLCSSQIIYLDTRTRKLMNCVSLSRLPLILFLMTRFLFKIRRQGI